MVRMKSMAETGYCFNVRRLRLQEKLVLLKYDPIGKSWGRRPACSVCASLTAWGSSLACARICPP